MSQAARGPCDLWAMILAGGDGTRLRRLTALVAGDERPKQFTKLVGDETLLDRTRHRVELVIPPEQTVFVLTRSHQRYWAPLRAQSGSRSLVVQPSNRGTAPAIVYALLRVAAIAPTATLAIVPSDHWVSDDRRFMAHVGLACAAASARPELVVLLGIDATSPETEYGWIEPGDEIASHGLRRIRRLWEKPVAPLARVLLDRGCLWNSFVIVARVPALLALVRLAVPDLWDTFAPVRDALGSAREPAVIESIYRHVESSSFSDAVLTVCPRNLAVLRVTGVEWSDWGHPARVLATLTGHGITPEWAQAAAAM